MSKRGLDGEDESSKRQRFGGKNAFSGFSPAIEALLEAAETKGDLAAQLLLAASLRHKKTLCYQQACC